MDNNFSSRKLWTTLVTMALIVATAIITLFAKPENATAFAALYPSMIGGLLALNGIYQASNVATKWVNGKLDEEPVKEEVPVTPETPVVPEPPKA